MSDGDESGRRIGVISDTHDLLRPEALRALRGSDLILHAGDICGPDVLQALRAIAPVIAVRGNNDQGPWADALPETTVVKLGSLSALMVHDIKTLRPGAVRDVQVVISGHSHQPKKETRDGVLYFNPGSAGPRRFTLPISIGRLLVSGDRVRATLVDLGRRRDARRAIIAP
ncbi:MAG TPA: metallophosphoesterase family protein [Vicinamibacteria bacterium]|nr:metallophosphoesterase family protein [Vicinamibacteria bacterium]